MIEIPQETADFVPVLKFQKSFVGDLTVPTMSIAPPIVLWMQSLSDQTRGRLLRQVEQAELTVAELCSILQLPQSTVSRHLKVLVDDGWLTSRRDGTSNFYRMASDRLEAGRKRLWSLVREQALTPQTCEQDDKRLQQILDERRSKSQAFFSGAVGQWDRMRTELFGRRLDAWAFAALLDPISTVGDLGCGTGATSQMLSPWVKRVIGIDSSAAMLQSAKRRCKEFDNVELRRGELDAIPIADEELDLALLVLVLPYADQPWSILREAYRVTRLGGRIAIIDMQPHSRAEYRDELGHSWLGFEQTVFIQWLEQSGWSDIRYMELPPDPDAKGPSLFALSAAKRTTADGGRQNTKN